MKMFTLVINAKRKKTIFKNRKQIAGEIRQILNII